MTRKDDRAAQAALAELAQGPKLVQLDLDVLCRRVTKIEHETTSEPKPVTKIRGRGRPPIGDRPMTGAERMRRYRACRIRQG